ncbi:MAG: hypothetical protein BMS9Abin01_0929 [Gammaproteobacteria bacterium]|nr:MAG: hypothetical protein BMS9Abin01_0929 [Gammaproteobacteria bacterium]
MSKQRGIDHLVIAVSDLPAARDRFSSFGFRTTPLGKQPWGTANHLVQFPRNFIELVGVVDPGALVPMSDEHFSFSAHNDRFLRRREGMSMLVLSTEDARADAAEWRERGLQVHEPVHWSRKATLPDGNETTVAFTLAFVTNPLMPEIAFFACQQHNPEAFWKPEYQAHENGATAISGVTLVADQPAEHVAFFSLLVGGASIEEEPDALSIHTDRGVIYVQSPQRFAAHYPSARLRDDTQGTVLMAASVDVADLDRVAHCLEENGVAFSRGDTAIQLADNQCCGVVLELVQIQS